MVRTTSDKQNLRPFPGQITDFQKTQHSTTTHCNNVMLNMTFQAEGSPS